MPVVTWQAVVTWRDVAGPADGVGGVEIDAGPAQLAGVSVTCYTPLKQGHQASESVLKALGRAPRPWRGTFCAVSSLRLAASRHPDDPGPGALIGEPAKNSEEFAAPWSAHLVSGRASGLRHLRHPEIGELNLDLAALLLGCADVRAGTWWRQPFRRSL